MKRACKVLLDAAAMIEADRLPRDHPDCLEVDLAVLEAAGDSLHLADLAAGIFVRHIGFARQPREAFVCAAGRWDDEVHYSRDEIVTALRGAANTGIA